MKKLVPKLYGQYFNFLSLFSGKMAAEQAFELFCTIRKGKVLEKQRDYLDGAKHERLKVCGHTLQIYRWNGNGETILLVHGWESNTFRWRNLIAYLTEADYNVLAFDAPAHGYSSGKKLHAPLYADCIQDIITHYKPKHLIGHSLGGMALLYNESRNRNPNVEKIVTIGSPSEFHEILAHFQNLLQFNDRVLRALEAYVFQRFGFQVEEFSSARFVENNRKKGLLLHDKHDRLAPFHASESVHTHWKGSSFIPTEGLGHSMHQPEINERIIAFLDA